GGDARETAHARSEMRCERGEELRIGQREQAVGIETPARPNDRVVISLGHQRDGTLRGETLVRDAVVRMIDRHLRHDRDLPIIVKAPRDAVYRRGGAVGDDGETRFDDARRVDLERAVRGREADASHRIAERYAN